MAEEGKGGGYSEHDDRVGGRGFPGRRRKGRGPFRGKMYSEVNPRSRPRRARTDEDDGDVPMAEPHDGPRGRYVPYAPRSGRLANINITVKREPGERGGGSGRDGGRRSWFKITIPYGKKYDKSWLLSSIQNLCSVPFTPVEFHYDHNRAQFYVEDATTASALKQVSRKITDRDNYKVRIRGIRGDPGDPGGSGGSRGIRGVQGDPGGTVGSVGWNGIRWLQSLNLGSNRLFRLDDLAELPLKAPRLKVLDLSRNEVGTETP
ncbi:PREDICTED: nuclear RNA export factor 1, partial [Pseudopodoces humilis]|uniref:nuclear RNA export factor 1 n=1 Tax=Pseudopodoces humilis TaxID=181119 RepID=UPI0006B77846